MKKYFEIVVTTSLLALSGIFHSPAFAFAVVAALFTSIIREVLDHKLLSMKDVKITIPEETKKQLQDLGVRINTLEFTIKQSGFFPTAGRP